MDEDDYENFDREESYQHSSSNDKDNSQSLPAAEETAIIDQNKRHGHKLSSVFYAKSLVHKTL